MGGASCAGDGLRGAEHLLQMGSNAACPDRAGFVVDMVDLFNRCGPKP